MGQSHFIAAIPEPVTKASGGERCPKFGQQERHVVSRLGADCSCEFGMERDFQELARLVLNDAEKIAIDVLPTHAYHVAAALTCVEQKRQSKVRS